MTKNEEEMLESEDNETELPDLGMAGMLMKRVRYFTDGAVIGSKVFVNEAFAEARERFTERRKDGARQMRGSGAAASGVLWSLRACRWECEEMKTWRIETLDHRNPMSGLPGAHAIRMSFPPVGVLAVF